MVNDEEKDLNKDLQNETPVEENINNIEKENEDASTEAVVKEENNEKFKVQKETKKNKPGFLAWLGSTVIDQLIALGLTYIIVFIVSFILPSFGYKLSDKSLMLFLVYIIINVIYGSVAKNKSIGHRILGF